LAEVTPPQRLTLLLDAASLLASRRSERFGVFVLPILKGKFGIPAVLGMVAAVSVLGLIATLVFGREDTE